MKEKEGIAETERLILRRYRKQDLQDLYEFMSDPEVQKYEPFKPMTMDEVEGTLEWRISTQEMIAVELKNSRKMIGNVYFGRKEYESYEIGYVFNRSYWRNGYAKESCAVLIEQAFSRGVHRIFANCDPENQSSWKLLESLAFEREAHFKQDIYFWRNTDGKPVWKDTFVYARLNPRGNENE